jgi:peptidoglycan/xylan/chitin deacetylase (PgdA/CDA1 family)
MKISMSFDVEPDLHTGEFKGITHGLLNLVQILDKHYIKATFFTTADCIEKYPQIFRKLKLNGHEIASHGYRHHRFDNLSINEKENSIKKTIEVFNKYLGENPRGFRAPQHSIDKDTLKLLSNYSFKYDSSKTPFNILQIIFFPNKIRSNLINFFSNPKKHKVGNIYEIPTTAVLIPFVSIIPRVFPKVFIKIYLNFLKLFFDEMIFYAHSWDFIELPKSRIDRHFSYKRLIKNIDFIIELLAREDRFVKMEDLINNK